MHTILGANGGDCARAFGQVGCRGPSDSAGQSVAGAREWYWWADACRPARHYVPRWHCGDALGAPERNRR